MAIDLARSAERIERDIETLAGPDYTLSDEAIRRYAYTQEYRNTLDYFTRELREIGFEVSEDPVGTLVARNRPRGEHGLRRRLPLRLEPQRRQVRRDDGRRHRAGGLPPERGARPRPAAPAHLVPRGGGLRLRADAARQPDHAPAGDRGGAARVVPRDRRRPQLLGARTRRPATSRSGGGSRSTSSTASSAGSRCTSSRRECSRTRATASASSRPSPATCTPTSSSTDAATTPGRRRWTSVSTRRCRWPRRSLELERLAQEAGKGTVGTVGEIEVEPGHHQRDRQPRPLLARHPRPG